MIHRSFPFVVILLLSASSISAQDWPQWRGPQRDGVALGAALPQTWPPNLAQQWKVEIGMGHSSPIVSAGKIFIHARKDENETVYCLNVADGKIVWQKSYPAPYEMNFAAIAHGKGPKSTPVISNGKLYTFGISGIVSCFDATSGELKWRKEFSKKFAQTSPAFGVSFSPLIEDDLLIIHAGGPSKGALMALNASTGETKWSWEGDGPGHASPIVMTAHGVKQIITQTQSYCIGVALAEGKLLWQMPFTTDYDQNIVTPLIYKDAIIISGLDKGTSAVRVSKASNAWRAEQVWHNAEMSMYMSSPVLAGDLLFGLSDKRRGQYFCLEATTGKTLWTSEGRQGENAALLNAGGILFLLNNAGELTIAKASAKAFEPIAKYEVSTSATWAHPVMVGKSIIVKDTATLSSWRFE
jgi:outer membrane protein assembly factor BamB